MPQDTSNIGNAPLNPPDGINNNSNLQRRDLVPNQWGVNPSAIPFLQGGFPNIPRLQGPLPGNQPANYLSPYTNYLPIPIPPYASGNLITGNSE